MDALTFFDRFFTTLNLFNNCLIIWVFLNFYYSYVPKTIHNLFYSFVITIETNDCCFCHNQFIFYRDKQR
jgi:hypothetical protein